MQAFFGYRNQQVSAYCDRNLRLHRVLAGAVAGFDPFEEQLHLPAVAVQSVDQLGIEIRRSNRDQTEVLISANKSLTYDVLM